MDQETKQAPGAETLVDDEQRESGNRSDERSHIDQPIQQDAETESISAGSRNDHDGDSSIDEKRTVTPLHKLLLEKEDDVCAKQFPSIIEETGDRINARHPDDGRTALHIAAQRGLVTVVSLMIPRANTAAVDDDKNTPLNIACQEGHEEVAKLLLTPDAYIDGPDNDGWYPLHWACSNGLEAIVQLLLDRDLRTLNSIEGIQGWTPLNVAAYRGHEGVVDTLVNRQADISVPDTDGWTPLMTALRRGHRQISIYLIQYLERLLQQQQQQQVRSKTIDKSDNEGKTPLMMACAQGFSDIVKRLLDADANYSFQDEDGKTALHHALQPNGDSNEKAQEVVLSMVTVLLRKGADLFARDIDGATAFHIAFEQNEREKRKQPDGTSNSLFQNIAPLVRRKLREDGSLEDKLVLADAQITNRHGVVKWLLSNSPVNKSQQPNGSADWSAIEWATHRQKPQVLLSLIATSTRTPETKKALDTAIKMVKASLEQKPEMLKSRQKTFDKSSHQAGDKKEKGHRGVATDKNQPSDEKRIGRLKTIKDILDHFTIAYTYRRTERFELPRWGDKDVISEVLEEHHCAIIQFYKGRGRGARSGMIRNVKEVIYEMGPKNIIEGLRQIVEDNQEAKAQFTWIHLPSTNVSAMILYCAHDTVANQ